MASGDVLAIFTPQANEAPTSNPATFDTRNNIPVLDFDAGTDESAVFSGFLPASYAGGGLTVKIVFMATSATTGNMVWQAAIERMNTDLDADSFAAAQASGQVAVNGTSGIPSTGTVAFTSGAKMDSLAASESYRIKVNRDADSTTATDDATGDGELLRVVVSET
jgi:hypothetical protein